MTMNKVSLKGIEKTTSPFDIPYLRIVDFLQSDTDPAWEKRFNIGYGAQTFVLKQMENKTFTIEFDTSIILGNQSWERLRGSEVEFDELIREAILLYRKYIIEKMHEDFRGQCRRVLAEKPVIAVPSFWRWNEIDQAVVMGVEFESSESTSNPKAVIGYNFAEGRYIARVGFKGRTWTEDSDTYSTTLTGAGMALNQIFYGYY